MCRGATRKLVICYYEQRGTNKIEPERIILTTCCHQRQKKSGARGSLNCQDWAYHLVVEVQLYGFIVFQTAEYPLVHFLSAVRVATKIYLSAIMSRTKRIIPTFCYPDNK